MITPEKFLQLIDQEDKTIFKLGTIKSADSEGQAKVLFDGEIQASGKYYLTVNYEPVFDDRVLLVDIKGTYLILGNIGQGLQIKSEVSTNKEDIKGINEGLETTNKKVESNVESIKESSEELDVLTTGNREHQVLLKATTFAVRSLVRIDELTEEELNQIIILYPEYELSKKYLPDDEFRYDDKLYRVIFEHTSQEDWKPDSTPSVYDEIQPKGVIAEWEQRQYNNPYQIGDKVLFEDEVWTAVGETTYSPAGHPPHWKKVVDNG